MRDPRTLFDILEATASAFPRQAMHELMSGARRTAPELLRAAERVAGGLHAEGVRRGDVVGVLLPNSHELWATYFGVLRAGAAVAPLSTPTGVSPVVAAERLARILEHGGIRHVVTVPGFEAFASAAGLHVRVMSPAALERRGIRAPVFSIAPDDLAVVQYTSGSTSSPKGVMLTHAQATAGVVTGAIGCALNATDVYCTWLPMCHDMGMMSTIAHLHAGAEIHFSSPSAFIKHAGDWIDRFAAVRATVYIGPNFSYQYLLDGVDDALLGRLDLSAVRIMLNGAETIDAHLIERFAARFAAAGLSPVAMFPVYGLAEATCAVTFPVPGEPVIVDWIDRSALANEGVVRPVDRTDERARAVVSVGRPLDGLELRIVDRSRRPVAADRVGEIEIRGRPVMSGYHRRADLTNEAVHDGWLATGDLGYRRDGRLFVTGRLKEVIKVRGSSFFPEDLEQVVRDLPDVYRHRCIAFALVDDVGERVGMLIETDVRDPAHRERLVLAARRSLATRIDPDRVELRLVEPRAIPRTTSGKAQRLVARERFRDGGA